MARPTTIDTEDILEAARAVFLEKGYGEATTASIAKRAGVSEGSVFKRFKGKAELFQAAMVIEPTPALERYLERAGDGDIRKNLELLALELLDFFGGTIIPRVMMFWSNRVVPPGPFRAGEHPSIRGIRQLATFFAAEMKLGRIQRSSPEVLARTFAGTLWHHCFLQVVAPREQPPSREAFAREVVDLLWKGIAPD